MKNLILVVLVLEFLFGFEAGLWAEDLKKFPTAKEEQTLSATGEALLKTRISELERRMKQLEDDMRFVQDETESLDRSIDDLRRRHV